MLLAYQIVCTGAFKIYGDLHLHAACYIWNMIALVKNLFGWMCWE